MTGNLIKHQLNKRRGNLSLVKFNKNEQAHINNLENKITGARWGIEYIPEKWIEQLDSDVKDFLKKFINFAITYVQ